MSLSDLARGMVEAVDPDRQLEAAREASGTDEPDVDAIAAAADALVEAAVAPLATNPELRERLVEVRRQHEQMIDELSQDELIEAGYSQDAADRARSTVESLEQFIEEHRDEITALQVLYSRPYRAAADVRAGEGARRTRSRSRRTSGRPSASGRPTRRSTARRCAARQQRVLTDLVSLVRFALHEDDELVAFPERVRERFQAWLLQQENAGREFTPEQLALARSWIREARRDVARRSRSRTSTTRRSSSTAGIGKAARGVRRRADAAARGAQRGACRVT